MRIYHEGDADITGLDNRVISVIGFGNQGRAQAENLRDSGVEVVIGNQRDHSFDKAIAMGFDTFDVPEAIEQADIHILLVPDEVMPKVFSQDIEPYLKPGQSAIVSSGYNLYYNLLEYPKTIDMIMIAPRMIGTGVRNGYLSGKGFPSMVAVHHDYTGQAKQIMLAISKAIGTLKMGALESSAEEETLCDLFHEHFSYIYMIRRAYEILVKSGVSPEAAILELWASGEEMELCRVYMTQGLFHQLKLHSQTSQYGQEVTGLLTEEEEEFERKRLHQLISNIKDGTFAREWAQEQEAGFPIWKRIHAINMSHPMVSIEKKLLSELGLLVREVEDS